MADQSEDHEKPTESRSDASRRHVRADARRNIDAVLAASKDLFARSGVAVPIREIAQQAGVGTGTLYRHFPNART